MGNHTGEMLRNVLPSAMQLLEEAKTRELRGVSLRRDVTHGHPCNAMAAVLDMSRQRILQRFWMPSEKGFAPFRAKIQTDKKRHKSHCAPRARVFEHVQLAQ